MFLIKILSQLPFSALYLLSDIIQFLLFRVLRYRRKVVTNNIKIAFPDFSSDQINETTKGFYKNLGDIIVETIKAYSVSASELLSRVTISNKDVIDQFYHQKQPVIVMTSHLCNWEWLLLSNCLLLDYKVDAVYKKLNNPSFNSLMLKIRSRFGALPVEKDSLLREVAKRRTEPRIIAMVSDQSPASKNAVHWHKFFGIDVPFYLGAEKIALAAGYPVLFVNMKRLKRGYYVVTFKTIYEPSIGNPSEITSKYIKCVEESIKKTPSDWLWSHKRWKHTRAIRNTLDKSLE